MITPEQLLRIRALLRIPKLSINQIADDAGVAWVTVQRIATGELREIEEKRCPTCGRLVALPCLACQTDRAEYPADEQPPPAAAIPFELAPEHAARLAELQARRGSADAVA